MADNSDVKILEMEIGEIKNDMGEIKNDIKCLSKVIIPWRIITYIISGICLIGLLYGGGIYAYARDCNNDRKTEIQLLADKVDNTILDNNKLLTEMINLIKHSKDIHIP